MESSFFLDRISAFRPKKSNVKSREKNNSIEQNMVHIMGYKFRNKYQTKKIILIIINLITIKIFIS